LIVKLPPSTTRVSEFSPLEERGGRIRWEEEKKKEEERRRPKRKGWKIRRRRRRRKK